MTIHRRSHSTIKPRRDLVVLGQSGISDFLLRGRVFCQGGAEMVLRAEEFGAGEGGAGEGVGERFGRVFRDRFGQSCLGFCGGRGGGEVRYFFLDCFA